MKTLVISDYDGTIAPIRRDPKKVRLSQKTKKTLKKLRKTGVRIVVISGRDREELTKTIPEFVEVISNRGNQSTNKRYLRKILRALTPLKKIKGVWIERKKTAVVVHFRKASKKQKQIEKMVKRIARRMHVRVIPGRKTFDILPRNAGDKDKIVNKIIANWHGDILFFGDDDSDAKAALIVLKKGGKAFLVKTNERRFTPRGAKMLNGIRGVQKQLEKIADALQKP